MRDLLFEIGSEEIPSRFFPQALKQLSDLAGNALREKRLDCQAISVFATPRRLALHVKGLVEEQKDIQEKVKGPSCRVAFDDKGEATKAAHGFARSHGVSLDSLTVERINGTEYLVVAKETKGEKTSNLLTEVLPELVANITFPKPMYWEDKSTRFARPIRWLVALFGEEHILFSYAGVSTGQETRGHRFLAPGPFTVKSPSHYFSMLTENHVVLCQDERRALIRSQIQKAAYDCGGEPLIEESLLEEVNYLVESPLAVIGSFSAEFLTLPQEVLVTVMQVHQRYFPVLAPGREKLIPYFIVIGNTCAENLSTVRRGNERVLRARLSDARFFFDEDRRVALEEYVGRLKNIVFHKELGTVYDKQQRISSLVGYLSQMLGVKAEEAEKAKRVAALCKADLATSMVSEFPELQGVMGREYAFLSHEVHDVAVGIYEHYLPRFTGDALPETTAGMLVSLADKFDTIAGCFKIGIEPTGSQDPYALRRRAQGVLALLLEGSCDLELEPLLNKALDLFAPDGKNEGQNEERNCERDRDSLLRKITGFFRQRIRYVLKERGLAYDTVEAVLGADGHVSNPLLFYRRAVALDKVRSLPLFQDLVGVYIRIANLASKAAPEKEPVMSMLKEEKEKDLYEAYCCLSGRLSDLWEKQKYYTYLTELASLQQPVDAFFDEVMVMVEDEPLRCNRLALLKSLQKLFLQVADLGKIQEQKL